MFSNNNQCFQINHHSKDKSKGWGAEVESLCINIQQGLKLSYQCSLNGFLWNFFFYLAIMMFSCQVLTPWISHPLHSSLGPFDIFLLDSCYASLIWHHHLNQRQEKIREIWPIFGDSASHHHHSLSVSGLVSQ